MMVTVLFDLDGTLADTAADITAAANAMLRDLSLRELSAADAESYIGDGMKRFVKRALTRTTAWRTGGGAFSNRHKKECHFIMRANAR